MNSRITIIALAIATTACFSGGAASQGFSTRPIRLLVAYPPGAATDFNSRVLAVKMSETLKQQMIVDNRTGANGIVATAVLARATPDGLTVMVVDVAHSANPALYDKLPYDTLKDFESIAMVTRIPMVLLVHPSLPVKTVKELVAYAKANAGKLNYGSAGVGSAMFLVAELFKSAAGIDMVQIAYKGGGPAVVDLIGGQLPVAFISLVAGMPHVNAGRARALGASGAQRFPAFPELPTIAESGVPGFEFYLWQAMIAPAGTPRATVTRLNSELNKALDNPEVKERLTQAGNELMGGTPQQAAEFIRAEMDRYRKIIKPEMRINQ